eukprot:Phypoly_transcript_08303.p1 GENE.Phypoly_transcript_08303~~Phypoly_transcript_08303.p1  ORF type:complete len:364 (+),score=49.93 Phypoly_transcript_08303:35-1093(+)
MEESNPDNNGSSNHTGSNGRQNNNIAQRFSRQISRTILPALRSLVRSNRTQQRTRTSISEPSIPPQPIVPISPLESTENIPPSSPTLATDPLICTNVQEPPQQQDDIPPLIAEEPSLPSIENGLQILNNLGDLANLDTNTDNSTTNISTEDMDTSPTNSRQRYRLVVYFEERSQEEHPTARYVAVIVGRLDELQFLLSSSNTSERGFSDILNNLFNAYAPKGTPPAAKDIIDSLPTVTMTEQEQCMICLENFVEGSSAVVLPCKHTFHGEECVKSWLKLHNSCPICRYELPVEDPEYESQRKERMIARGFTEEEHTHSHARSHSEEGDVDMGVSESDNNVGWLFGDDEPRPV